MNVWDLFVLQPMVNILVVMSHYLAGSFGLAIIFLTILVNLVMLPLTLKQSKTSKAMQELQPKLAELQKKYSRDRQKLAQEQMKLYKESGLNPSGCLGPMLIQMPIWIALYQSVMMALAVAPEGLLNLSRYLYSSWPVVFSILPLNNSFLWLNMANPDMFLAIMVGATMWVQQKMTTPISNDPKQRSQAQMMLWMMPLMFTFLALSFPSGLSLFWVTSSIVRIVIQYYATGWGGLVTAIPPPVPPQPRSRKRIAQVEKSSKGADISADIVDRGSTPGEGLDYGKSGDKRQDRGRSYPTRPGGARRQPRRDKGNGPEGK